MAKSSPKWDVRPEYAEIFEIGQRLELIVLDEGNPRTYPSQIQDLDESEMYVAVPTYKGAAVHVGIGSEITVSSLVSGARYMGTATVLAREFIPVEVLKLVRPETVRRVQFRENFRVEIRIPECVVHVQPADDPSVTEELEAEITNLSAGGGPVHCRAKCPDQQGIPVGEVLVGVPARL